MGVFGCMNFLLKKSFLREFSHFDSSKRLTWGLVEQLFERAVWTQKALFQKAIGKSFL